MIVGSSGIRLSWSRFEEDWIESMGGWELYDARSLTMRLRRICKDEC